MIETINSIPSRRPGHFISFDVTPHGDVVKFTTAYQPYVWDEQKVGHPDDPNRIALPAMYYHDINTELTFTGKIVEPMLAVEIEEWYWDFGDGIYRQGNPITHSYPYANPGTLVHVRARGTDLSLSYATMNLMLRPSSSEPPIS